MAVPLVSCPLPLIKLIYLNVMFVALIKKILLIFSPDTVAGLLGEAPIKVKFSVVTLIPEPLLLKVFEPNRIISPELTVVIAFFISSKESPLTAILFAETAEKDAQNRNIKIKRKIPAFTHPMYTNFHALKLIKAI
ncbi:hypothetical protein MBCUR_01090 [Methanobrevibacter curvatus]|uniref:Uncharacterized protein n=1 Tax=Methanobrevibacter curvatus TaxID=49547 RepID=A0A166E358_9EURY|nr:hypothetical protein MBCUR_01090 [Methanobrevibacter curvatus]